MRRTSLLALAGLLGGALTVLGPVAPASADEVYDRPADGTFEVEGHGWGHGRGMSQWGAQGAASLGKGADEITATYYPGTTRSVLEDRPLRVWLSSDEGRDTAVFPADGLRVTDLATGSSADLPDGPTRWRVTVVGSALQVAGLTGSTWTPLPVGGSTALAGPVRFSGPTFVRVALPGGSSRDYRGAVQAVRTGSSLKTVDVLGLEDYLLGVVPREASSGWRPAALQAQAIAARTYSAYKRDHVKAGADYDICDTTACQVFGGSRLYTASGSSSSLEPASTTDAVRATRGVVRTLDGRPVLTEFSSSNGGWSTAGNVPYLAAREDPWDGAVDNPVHSWRASLPVSVLERRFPSVGTLQRMRVTARDGNGEWGGRVRTVVLEGTGGSVTTTGAAVYAAAAWPASSSGLRSTWWHVTQSTGSTVEQQSAAPSLVRPPGASTGAVSVALRNTGTTSWPVDGLHLAISSPPGQADALAGGSTRPGTFTGNRTRPGADTVAPGEVGTFTVALDAAGVAAGTHTRVYRLRVGDGPVFGAAVTWRVPVADALFAAARAAAPVARTAQSSSDAPPPVFADGRTVVLPRTGSTKVRVTVRNTGNVTWPVDGNVQLGTSAARDRASASAGSDWLSPRRATRLVAAGPVAPGSTGAFDLVLSGAGRSVGVTTEAFEPVWAGRHWLDGAPTGLAVVRVDPAVSRLAMLHSAARTLRLTTKGAGSTATLVVRLRNLGGSAWPVGTEGMVAAAAEPLRTSAWGSATRAPALAANAVRPSVRAVHPGEIGEWRVPFSAVGKKPGTYTTTLRPVGPGGAYGPSVTVTTTVVAG